MKKLFALLLALMLLLVGCTDADVEETETTIPVETTPQGYYVEGSPLEIQTAGAVRQCVLPDAQYLWIKSVGDRLLLATDTDPVRLLILAEDTCIPVAECEIASFSDNCAALFNGFAYYDNVENAVIFLDPQLNQTQSISLPGDATNVVISEDGNNIYYCVGNEIRTTDVAKKLSRLIKTQIAQKQALVGTCFNGAILICDVEDDNGNVDTLYISTQNGQTISIENSLRSLYSYEDNYVTERMDGTVLQRIVGTRSGEASQLNITDANLVGALELGSAIGYNVDENGLLLNYYDLTSGKKISSVKLQGIAEPQAILADKWNRCIWLLVADPSGTGTLLLQWDITLSAIQDEQSYVGTLYTANNPDTAELQTLNDRISALNKKYGVRIRVWEDAIKTPGKYALVPEHQVSVITDTLDDLEGVLAEFPKSFISKSISSKVRICLVRSVDGESKGVQYWSGSNAYIALSTGIDIRSEFLKAFGSVIDSHVLGNSAQYDYWGTLNPSGFLYGANVDESLTTGENRAFVDVESMITGTIDRSHVFWQAMLPENADMFSGETMQKKLIMLCKAIRDAWNLEKSTEEYPWEQYLTNSLARKKK